MQSRNYRKCFTHISKEKTTMATNKKAKHSNVTAVTSNTEHPTTSPEHIPTNKTNDDHHDPVPITPDRSNRASLSKKHPRDVTETNQVTPTVTPIVHNTWAAWKAIPNFPIRVIITHIIFGGGKNEKKPSWMLLTPVNYYLTRRYICWDRAPMEKLNVSVGQICDIIGLREVAAFAKVTAFVPNYKSDVEYTGTLTITNQTDINAEYTPIPPLTASLLHQNAGVGRVCGVVEVISTPTIMALSNSYVPDHENEQIPNLTFDIKLDDKSTTGAFIWGDLATSLHEQSIAVHTRLLLIRAFAKTNGDGLSISPKSASNKQPMIILLSPQQSAAQDAAIESIQTLPDPKVMVGARYHALQKRVTALQAELRLILSGDTNAAQRQIGQNVLCGHTHGTDDFRCIVPWSLARLFAILMNSKS
jgi:hypothetical protein